MPATLVLHGWQNCLNSPCKHEYDLENSLWPLTMQPFPFGTMETKGTLKRSWVLSSDCSIMAVPLSSSTYRSEHVFNLRLLICKVHFPHTHTKKMFLKCLAINVHQLNPPLRDQSLEIIRAFSEPFMPYKSFLQEW